MDVYGPLNVSLDYRLRFSPIAADIIHQLLDVIYDTLRSLKSFSDRPQRSLGSKRRRISGYRLLKAGDDASDSESDGDLTEENMMKITETIGGTLTRLFRLSNAVRKSAKANRARKIEKYRDDIEANQAIEELRLYTQCYIDFRFPETPEAICSALVNANALRLRRLWYQRSHRRRIDLSLPMQQPPPVVVQLPEATRTSPAVRFAPSPAHIVTKEMPDFSPAPATFATTARQTAVAAFYARSTTEVPRAKSVLVNNKLSFPPLPPTQECPYCGVIVEFGSTARTTLWHNHVIGDLEPFICLHSQCLDLDQLRSGTSPPTFETSKAWTSHMKSAHGHTWECRAPSHHPIVFDQELLYQKHSIEEHGVPEAHAGNLSNAARRPVLGQVLECPFGDDFQYSGKSEHSDVFSSEALQLHIAGHMKEIALLTLQKLPNDDDGELDNLESDQVLGDDEPNGMAGFTRASMYSILDDEELDLQSHDAGAEDNASSPHEEDISAQVTVLGLEDEDDLKRSKLHRAVQARDPDLIKALVQSGTNVNAQDENGHTPLHYATQRGFVECTELLIDNGADLRMTDGFGFSPLLWAVVAGQEGATRMMLSKGSDANSFSADGRSALAWAASLGWSLPPEVLLEHGASVSDSRGEDRTLPLDEAAACGNLPYVRSLLKFGADPNHRNRDGWSAIHWAAEEGHLDAVRMLLDAGARPNVASSYGTSPLHCAANGGHVAIVSLLLSRQADPLKSTCHGWTALHHAAFMGHSHVVEALLRNDRARSTVSQQDNHGWSTLHLAVFSRDVATINTLLQTTATTDLRTLFDESGLTAEEWLDRGSRTQSQETRGNLAFSKSRCCRGVTGLRLAVTLGHVQMIRLLLGLGHDINGVNSGKRTALYYAAKQRMHWVVDVLLTLGATPNILPVGRKRWEDFLPDSDILLRLVRAGYSEPGPESDKVSQIYQALRAQGVLAVPDQIMPDEKEPSRSDRDISLGPEQPRNMTGATTSIPTRLRVPPTSQPGDNKRKAKSGRSDWWKRLMGGNSLTRGS
ncbi:unnamed protein product [Zymoseptoria tritici ST99CH_3D1]|nr:unnamed protein product [Zymoseptoria tritici ST99CH_3D1]